MKTYLKACRWGTFILLQGDLISRHADLYGEWAQTEVELFALLLPSEGVCIEVGSNIGMHSVPISQFCRDGKVFCYEPQRPIFHVLCGNMALNNCLNVVARRLAVGAGNERIAIQSASYDQAWNYGAFSIEAGFSAEKAFTAPTGSEAVDMISLDEDPELADIHKVDLIKIDAEGSEPRIVAGARRLIARCKPYLFVEANSAAVLEQVLTELSGLDYQGYWFASARFRDDNFNGSDVAMAGCDVNVLFCPPERSRPSGPLLPVRDFADLARGVPVLGHFP